MVLIASVAALQVAVALRLEEAFFVAVVLGWASTLVLSLRDPVGTPRRLHAAVGALVLATACVLAVIGHLHDEPMRRIDRLLPLTAGFGIALLTTPARELRRHARKAVLLAIPIVTPFPYTLASAALPVPAVAASAAGLLHVVGFPVRREGSLLHVPNATVEVIEDCCGLGLTSELLALAIVVMCVFPTTRVQKVLLAAASIAAGFAGTAIRLASHSVAASTGPDRWDFWHRPGLGSHLFPIITVLLACGAWWLVIAWRRRPDPLPHERES